MGLVDRVVASSRLGEEVQQFVATILQGAPDAVRQTKRLLRELRLTDDLPRLFSRALEFHMQARRGEEAREGLAAFRDRRDPTWSSGAAATFPGGV